MFDNQQIHSTADARSLAKKRLPWMVFDYIDGAAADGYGETLNRSILRDIRLRSSVLINVEKRSLDMPVFHHLSKRPFGICPMGMCNLTTPKADIYLAKLAARESSPVGVSTAASTSLEQMIELAEGHAWFQLYFSGDGTLATKLIQRAHHAGYKTLVVTVDVPEIGRRPRELKRGFKMPFHIGPSQFIDFALHPRWSLTTLATGRPTLANFGGQNGEFDRTETRARASWDDLHRIREQWKGQLVVKGVLNEVDAVRLQKCGVNAVQVSSHGGRQLESAAPPILALQKIRQAVGPNFPLFYDSGIRTGEDVVKAYALGANYVFLGRALLFGLAARGEEGLHAIWDTLTEEASICMAQLGLTSLSHLAEDLVWTWETDQTQHPELHRSRM